MKRAIGEVRDDEKRPTEELVSEKIRPQSIAPRTLRDWLVGGPSFAELVAIVDAERARQLHGGRAQSDLAPLSQREVEVRDRLAQRMTNRKIAAELHLSVKTVENYVYRVLHKLGMRSRREVTQEYLAVGQVPIRLRRRSGRRSGAKGERPRGEELTLATVGSDGHHGNHDRAAGA